MARFGRRSPSAPLRGLSLALILGLAAPAFAAAPAPPPEGSPFPEVRREVARTRLAVAMRFEIEEQLVAAAAAYEQALKLGPMDPQAQRQAGRFALREGNLPAASAAFASMTRLDPYGSGGYALLGLSMAMQQDKGASVYLGKALEMDREAASTRLPLIRLARESGDWDRVEQLLQEVAPEDRDELEVQLEWLNLEYARNKGREARARSARLTGEEAPPAAVRRVGELLLGLDLCDEAFPLLRRAATADPTAESLRSYGWGLLLCGYEAVRAAGAFSAALQKDNNDDGARVGLAWALLRLPKRGEGDDLAAAWLDEVLRRNPKQVQALLGRAEAHRRKKELDQALALLSRIPPTSPGSDEADNLRGLISLQKEDPYGAIRTLRALLGRRPDRRHARMNLALALVRAGRSSKAQQELEIALAGLPAHHPLRVHASRVLGSIRRR